MRFEEDATLRVVNVVDLEPYLYGVVPAEIGAKSPLEALKAQAVAARTYTLKNRGKLAREGMDLDDTTRCQSYLGIDGETPFVTAAVDATHGQVITFGDALIDATYSNRQRRRDRLRPDGRAALSSGRAGLPGAGNAGIRRRCAETQLGVHLQRRAD